jgi:L-threonylcarbamoyladenylate synthase|tara:strand:- start:7794 stop:8312 length:519 start_codon:yes stop_codon:yes gene_type:complete
LNTTKKIEVAANWILNKEVIAYPTEGVWGLGGLYMPEIIGLVSKIKSRPIEKKYILLFSSLEQLNKKFKIDPHYFPLLEKYQHTFTTMVIPTTKGKIAARIPKQSMLLDFLQQINAPIISTSANISGKGVCKNVGEIKSFFDDKIYGVLDLPLGGEKKASEIIDLETNEYIR